jgi:hypothetical protein
VEVKPPRNALGDRTDDEKCLAECNAGPSQREWPLVKDHPEAHEHEEHPGDNCESGRRWVPSWRDLGGSPGSWSFTHEQILRHWCSGVGGGAQSLEGVPLPAADPCSPVLACVGPGSDTPGMRSGLILIGALLLAVVTACSLSENEPEQALPTVGPSAVVTTETVPPASEPTLTCGALPFGEVSETGSGFVVELNIMSGNPNPAWRLSNAEGVELRRLLQTTRDGIDVDGPDELGGFGVVADRRTIGFLRRLGLPSRFWVQGDGKIAKFLGGTPPCNP